MLQQYFVVNNQPYQMIKQVEDGNYHRRKTDRMNNNCTMEDMEMI
ncbi:unnamed protein product [Schistosoma mattheei]|uniref:Uncharacterized protein n=1 Tax=Schistosoma mattheei TaxID=31246 RepID=A0A3P8CWW0_9TREM|nr:unnamed protein product [Schistosoma mattheei]